MAKYNLDEILSELARSTTLPVRRALQADNSAQPDEQVSTPSAIPDEHVLAVPVTRPDQTPSPRHDDLPLARPQPAAGVNDIYAPDASDADQESLGDRLVSTGAITPLQLSNAMQVVRQSPGRQLVDVLFEQGADEQRVQQAVAAFTGVSYEPVDLDKGLDGGFDGRLLQRLGTEFCKAHMVLPLRMDGRRAIVGMIRAHEVFLLDDIRQKLGVAVKPVLVTPNDVRAALEIVGESTDRTSVEDLSEILADVEESDVELEKKSEDEVDLEKLGNDGPVIRYVNHIIQTAVREGASDIHVEPGDKKLKVRFRIDGELYEMLNPPAGLAAALTSRLKIMANLDIAERRIPQDGRIRCTVHGRKLDLRVSTLPTPHGEKTVMRILDTRSINVQLEDLGFDEDSLVIWRKQIERPHGIILVTGPTGSGKTTTLYASLRQLDKTSMNISTVEDPIEYHLDGITQTQTHEKIGLTFSRALKALLRQDPDVIMLGEIRDHDTAVTAIQAALTGHLVLSTLHTNDAPSSVTRLINIGVEPFLVGAALNSVLAQRLVRRLCLHCRVQEPPLEELAEYLQMQGFALDQVWVAKGCERCRNTGYSGRMGIYELLTIDDSVRDIIARNPNVAEFRRLCLERGMVSLRADGMKKVAAGITTVEEILRVTEAVI